MRAYGYPVLAAVTVAAAVALAATYRPGLQYGGNTPVLVVGLAAAVLVTFAAARRASPEVAARLAATGAALLLYLLAGAGAAWYAGVHGHVDPLAWLLVQLQATGHIAPLVLLQLAILAALPGVPPALERIVLGYAGAYVVVEALTMPALPPYDGLRQIVDAPAVAWVAAVPWMATVLLGPVLAWRALPRATDAQRHRLLPVAIVSVLPIVTIVFCLLAGALAFGLGVLPPAVGEAGLALAFALPFVLCAPGLALATGPHPPAATSPERATLALSVLVGLSFAIVVISVSAAVGVLLGADALLPVVIGTLVVAAAFAPLRRRLVRALVLRVDPARARAAALVRAAGPDARARPARAAQEILRAAVRDPDARLLLRLPEDRRWVDVDGNPVSAVDGPETARLETAADAAGALAEAAPLLDRAVLEMAVRRSEEAAAEERRRLERDLHDGVQGRLLALALDLRMAQRDIADGPAQLVLSDAVDGLSAAIDELRALAAGTTPERLSRYGLRTALADLVERMPVPVTLRAPPDRLPPPVEAVAYLVVCEAVTNALKHARAGSIAIDVAVADGQATVVVSDDGQGGADLRAGTGLRGLTERVGAAGGRLVVGDRRPSGTTLEVTLPCGS